MSENNTISNTSMNVSLPETLKEYVQDRISEGIYSNHSDYVRSLIREDMHRQAERRLEALVLEGLNSGPTKPVDWDAIRKEAYRLSGKTAPGV